MHTCVHALVLLHSQAGVLAVNDPPALAALCAAGSSSNNNGNGSTGTDTHYLGESVLSVGRA